MTVAPWAARTMPGLFALNERVVLSGQWNFGFFSFAAVGAYNVGSINLAIEKVSGCAMICNDHLSFVSLFTVYSEFLQ